MYLRLSRTYPDLYAPGTKFECGRGAIVRRARCDGNRLRASVHKAIEAAEILAERGISVRVVDMYSIKPIDSELI